MSEPASTYQLGTWSALEQFLCLSCGASYFSEAQMTTHLLELHGLPAVVAVEEQP